MLRTMNRLMALSLGMAFPVETQRTRLTCPRPFLLRPWLRLLTVIVANSYRRERKMCVCEKKIIQAISEQEAIDLSTRLLANVFKFKAIEGGEKLIALRGIH